MGGSESKARERNLISRSSILREHLQRIARFNPDLSRYQWGKVLGEGSFGRVVEATDGEGHRYAVKMIKMKKINRMEKDLRQRIMNDLAREIDLMAIVSSHVDCFPKFYGKIEEGGKIYLFFELIEGRSLIDLPFEWRKGTFTLPARVELFLTIARCLEVLHHLGIAHRDLKPQNVMIPFQPDGSHPTGEAKIVDFGFGCLIRYRSPVREALPDLAPRFTCPLYVEEVGSLPYMAPELSRRSSTDHLAPDIYALGRIAYLIFWNEMYDEYGKFSSIRPLTFSDDINNEASKRIYSLVKEMINSNPGLRPTISDTISVLEEIYGLWTHGVRPPILDEETID